MNPHGLDVTLFVWLLLVASIVAMAAQRYRLPYALALVVTGLAIGMPRLLEARLDPHTLFTLLLPPLLFEAAINLHAHELRRDWRPIGLYALVGTLVSTAIVGGAVSWLGGLPLPVALVFGALIAPTDPISVIAVMKRLGVSKRLGVIVEAESLFNDGVAVVVFVTLLQFALGEAAGPGAAALRFAWVMLGGIGVGLMVGFGVSRATRPVDDHLVEIMLTTIAAYGAYVVAEAFGVSGVVAVVASGLVVGSYGMATSMTAENRLAVHSFWEYAAFVANSVVFLLIGLEAAHGAWWSQPGLVVLAVGSVLTARAISVYGLALPLRAMGAGLPVAWQHLLFWGGLRGALSMALALGLPMEFPHRETVVAMTFGYVLFSLLVQGLTVGGLIGRLGLREAPPA
jgi:CPA1 family monovalent cation:H+ antiporter